MAITQAHVTMLATMPFADLNDLSAAVREQMERRSWEATRQFRVGDIIEFGSRKRNRHVTVRIDSIGSKNLIGFELLPDGKTGPTRWTVHPSLAKKVVGNKPTGVAPSW